MILMAISMSLLLKQDHNIFIYVNIQNIKPLVLRDE